MSTRRLLVVLHDELIGTVDQSAPAVPLRFTYDPDYLAHGAVPLGLRLPLAAGVPRSHDVTAFLEGVLPEDPATRARWAADLGTAPDDTLGILSRMGWDCPGAVQFCTPDDLDDLRARRDERIPLSDAAVGARLRALRDGTAPSWTLPEEHWSLAGQQPKLALARVGGSWHEAHGSAATTHILKPGIGRLLHQDLVEHATMRAAAAVGVEVARTEYRTFDGEPAVVVERYDRAVRADGSVLRLHQEDFCSATGRLPDRKYEAHGGPGLKDLALVVRRHVDATADGLRALGDFVAVNYVAGAPDGHAKNLSLFLLPGQVTVAPLYDLATGLAYEGGRALREVAISIGGRRAFGTVLGKHWDKAAAQLGMPPERYRERVRTMAAGFTDAFTDALAAVDTPESDQVRNATLSRMEAHTRDVLARLDDPAGGDA